MKLVFIFFIILFLNNCSLNKDSKYWTEAAVENVEDQKKISEVLKKTEDITNMTDYDTAVKVLKAMSVSDRKVWLDWAHNKVVSGRSFTDKEVELVMQNIWKASVIEFYPCGATKPEQKPRNEFEEWLNAELNAINKSLPW